MSIEQQRSGGIVRLTINRPERRNALTKGMYTALAQALQAARADAGVRAVILAGAGGHFTAGNDLEDFMRHPPSLTDGDWSQPPLNFMKALLDCDKVVIAAVEGHAVGIGATLLLHCDFVVLAEDARLLMPFVNLGLCPEFASSLLLPLHFGRARASRALLLGEPMSAAEWQAAGLASAMVPAAEVQAQAMQIAEKLQQLAPSAIRASKRLIEASVREQILAAAHAENRVFAERLREPEAREAMQAFFEKRRPDFSRF
jgi:enoyl-CoA hydratase/carnithine racemase